MNLTRSLLGLCLLSFSVLASAEDMSFLLETTPNQRAESQTRFMANKLGLNGEALQKVQAINQEYAEKVEPVLKGSAMGLVKKHQIDSLQSQKDDALRGILNATQFDAYINAKDELKQAMQQDLKH